MLMPQSGAGYEVKREGVVITLVFQCSHRFMACEAGERPKVMGADHASVKYLVLKQFQAKKSVKIRSHFN